MTGGRLSAVESYIKDEESFCFTYGDGVSDIDITKSIAFHEKHGKKATVTAVYPSARFGALKIEDDFVRGFEEKPKGDVGLLMRFYSFPKVLELINGKDCVWELSLLLGLLKWESLRRLITKDLATHGYFTR